MAADQDKLTEKVSLKLGEIIQFVEQYSSIEQVDIEFVDNEKAASRDKKRNILKQQEILNSHIQSQSQEKVEKKRSSGPGTAASDSVDDEEFKTPEGSFEGEQGNMSPLAS